tara:strand:- start:584 stop:814 length:231 start_codon:yes stop_codon:yes gene_type:complete
MKGKKIEKKWDFSKSSKIGGFFSNLLQNPPKSSKISSDLLQNPPKSSEILRNSSKNPPGKNDFFFMKGKQFFLFFL